MGSRLFGLKSCIVLGGLTALIIAHSPSVLAQVLDEPINRASLKGAETVAVYVIPLDPVAEEHGVMGTQIQTSVELRLRQAGIRVVPYESPQFSGVLNVAISIVQARTATGKRRPVYGYSVFVGFEQPVRVVRNPGITLLATTWSQGIHGMMGSGAFADSVRGVVADVVDRFINAYLEQNPEQ